MEKMNIDSLLISLYTRMNYRLIIDVNAKTINLLGKKNGLIGIFKTLG